jgi:hypothetical protein
MTTREIDHEASDEVLDLMGAIALQRQAMERDSGAAPARNEALRKLNALLARERDELQSHGPGGRHAANVGVLVLEVEKLRKSANPASARAGYSRRNQWGLVSQPGEPDPRRRIRRGWVRSVFGRRSP